MTVTSHPPTSSAPAGQRRNDFDALRLLGAVLVIVGHGFVLHGEADAVPEPFGLGVHTLGVAIFFAISGYLIFGSWRRRPDPVTYFASRAARILPALALVTVLTVLVIGPIATTASLGAYASSGETWAYLANLFPVLPQYSLPGVFTELPYPDVVNGSLWTLRVEFLCYLAVAALAFVPARARPIAIGVAGLLAAVLTMLQLRVAGSDLSAATDVLVYFAVGALLRFVPAWLLNRWTALGTTAVWALASWLLPDAARSLSWIALPVVVVSLGLASTPVVRSAARGGDLSYGMYLWAFPVQQLLLQFAPDVSVWGGILLVTLISGLLALGSWHLVEARAMRAKDAWLRGRSRPSTSADRPSAP